MRVRILRINLIGQSLIEGLVALSMASIIIIAIVATVTASVATNRITGLKNRANQLVQDGIEIARASRNAEPGFYCVGEDETVLSTPTSPSNCDNEPNVDSIFARSVEVVDDSTECSVGVNEVTVTVSWTDNQCSDGVFCQNASLSTCLTGGGIVAGNYPFGPTNTPTNTPSPTIAPTNTPTPTLTPTPTPNPYVTSCLVSPTSHTLTTAQNWRNTKFNVSSNMTLKEVGVYGNAGSGSQFYIYQSDVNGTLPSSGHLATGTLSTTADGSGYYTATISNLSLISGNYYILRYYQLSGTSTYYSSIIGSGINGITCSHRSNASTTVNTDGVFSVRLKYSIP